MSSKQRLFLGFLLLILLTASRLIAQTTTVLPAGSLLLQSEVVTPRFSPFNTWSFDTSATNTDFPSLEQWMGASVMTSLPTIYCAADLAFFCRLEVKLEKATKMPVRFRIGDVQQVDYLEGKFEGWRYGH